TSLDSSVSSPKRAVRRCVDCEKEGVRTRRKAPFPGPRCATHNRAVRKQRSSARKANHVEETYNITEDQYWELYDAQGGLCYICGRVQGQNRDGSNGRRKRLSVDHDHSCCNGPKSCGKCVRGLLCTTCNKFLGWIRDNPQAMERGAYYLVNPPARLIVARG